MNDEIDLGEVVRLSLFSKLKIKFLNFWADGKKRKQYFLGIGLGLLGLGLIAGGVWISGQRKKTVDIYETKAPTRAPTLPITPIPPEEPKDYESPLDGVRITKGEYEDLLKRKPLAVMVDNLIPARPQAGLNEADLIYEALAEGGISRFLPIFLHQAPEKVGPVRSIRAYFLDWIAEYDDPLLMHIGGAGGPNVNPLANALATIQKYGMKSVGISVGGNFWRVSERFAPHNAYTSIKMLWEKTEKMGDGWVGPWHFPVWQFKEDETLENRPAEGAVSFNWNGWGKNAYSVRWIYEPSSNRYLREQGGQVALDESGKQLGAKNIILQFSLQTLANDEKAHILYETVGLGRALIFRDGKTIEGKWEKNSRIERTRFLDAQGNEVKFNRGQTWIEVLPTGSEIEYK